MEPSEFNPKYHKMQGEFMYKGYLWPRWTSEEHLKRIESGFNFTQDDIIIASYPKTGTTLTQEIVWLLKNNFDTQKALKYKVFERVPMIEDTWNHVFSIGSQTEPMLSIDFLHSIPPPRLIKTHATARNLLEHIQNTKFKVIVPIRNPKDTMVSYYHFYKGALEYGPNGGPFEGTWNDYFNMWMDDWIGAGDWFSVTKEWWELRNYENVLVVKYEDLLKKPDAMYTQIADFLGVQLSAQNIATVKEHTRFSNMKNNASANYENEEGFDKDFTFMRKGEIGDWKNWFTVRQNELFDAKFKPLLNEINLHFEYE